MSMTVGKWFSGVCLTVCLVALGLAFVGALVTVKDSPSYSRTESLVKLLDDGCKMYRLSYGRFPPSTPDGDSSVLVRLLGAPREIDGVKRPPIVEFKADMLAAPGGPVVDEWGRPIKYLNPGVHNRKGVDLWSSGRNGADEGDPKRRDFDDIVNWLPSEG